MGLATTYLENGQMVELMPPAGSHFLGVGSKVYMSIYAHTHLTIFPIDDIESIGYVLVKIYRGHLPWEHLHSLRDVLHKKEKTKFYVGKSDGKDEENDVKLMDDEAEVLAHIVHYARKQPFNHTPDYDDLRKRLRDALKSIGGNESDEIDYTTYVI